MSIHVSNQTMRVMRYQGNNVWFVVCVGKKSRVVEFLKKEGTENVRVEVFIKGHNRRIYGEWVGIENVEIE